MTWGSAAADGAGCVAFPETVAYESLPGVPADATSVDVYAPPIGCLSGGDPAPVVMWVHGGGYHSGDKSNQVANKVKLFNGLGYIFISVNYRLTVVGDPSSAHFPDHYRDAAAAVAWARAHVAARGGDPRLIALLGHSAGADIVSNLAVNPTWLGERGLGLSALQCAGPLDTEGFDKVRASEGGEKLQWLDALGNNPDYETETSASHLIKAETGVPPTITVFRGTALRQQIETAFAQHLRDAGVATTLIDARSLSHGEVNSSIGAPGDTIMTAPIAAFLADCFAVDADVTGTVSAKDKQRQRGRKIIVKVKVTAGEDLDAEASGKIKVGKRSYKLRPKTKTVNSGSSKNLKLKPKKSKDAKQIAKKLKKGKKAKATLKLKLTDEAGNKRSEKLLVKLKR